MNGLATAVFATSFLVCWYVYLGYPALLVVLSRTRARPVARRPIAPTLTVIVAAHNEELVIEGKLRNTLAAEYPADRLELIVASDGSTDRTEAIVAGYADPRVRLLALPRGGKALALNAAAREAGGEVLVFTDANTMIETGTLRALVESLADPRVGAVCGDKRCVIGEVGGATSRGEGLYWRFDQWLKSMESRIGSAFAADGALYAVRRELFTPISDARMVDDIAISARVVLQGARLIYEPRAVVLEEAPTDPVTEFRRKVRVTNHSLRAVLGLGPALWSSGFYSVQLVSHKLLRHLAPCFLILLLLSSAVLAPSGIVFRLALLGQVGFYGLGAAGYLLRGVTPGYRWLAAPYYFCFTHAAALMGVLSIARGEAFAAWTPRGGLRARGAP